MGVFSNSTSKAGYDTRSILKWSITEISELSVSKVSNQISTKEPHSNGNERLLHIFWSSSRLVRAVKYANCKECPRYCTKPSSGEALVLEFWWMWSTLSLPLLSVPLWHNVVVPIKFLPMGQLELFNHLLYVKLFNSIQMTDVKLNYLYLIGIRGTI